MSQETAGSLWGHVGPGASQDGPGSQPQPRVAPGGLSKVYRTLGAQASSKSRGPPP